MLTQWNNCTALVMIGASYYVHRRPLRPNYPSNYDSSIKSYLVNQYKEGKKGCKQTN